MRKDTDRNLNTLQSYQPNTIQNPSMDDLDNAVDFSKLNTSGRHEFGSTMNSVKTQAREQFDRTFNSGTSFKLKKIV
jgi:hypothetical protein